MRQHKELALGGRTYIIQKFTPETGCRWAFKVFGNMGSLLGLGSANTNQLNAFITEITKNPDEFKAFQKDCLGVILCQMPAGTITVMDSMGNIAVPDMEPKDVFHLTVASFIYSLADFFDPAMLTGMADIVTSLFPQTGSEASSPSP